MKRDIRKNNKEEMSMKIIKYSAITVNSPIWIAEMSRAFLSFKVFATISIILLEFNYFSSFRCINWL